jgi:ubiquitin-protein ligase
MATPQESRRIRLKNDYKEMQNIQGKVVQWHPLSGDPPFVDAYELTINVRTIIGPRPNYRDKHIVKLVLPPTYPETQPQIVMLTQPQPYHPNWYTDARWCGGGWIVSEGLGHYVVRMIRTLQFDAEITNPGSAANTIANEWYLSNRNHDIFPCDRQILPDPTSARFKMVEKKTFRIE